MRATHEIPSLSQLQAKELAGKEWTWKEIRYRFANYDPNQRGVPPWKSGAEGIAYPLLDSNSSIVAYLKFFDAARVTPKRVKRCEWLISQELYALALELRAAPCEWVDTRENEGLGGVPFDFAGCLAQGVPGRTWLELKADVADGKATIDGELRDRCVENLIRALALLEQLGIVHGDLSPNNVIVDAEALPGDPTLYLIDFDGFVAPGAGPVLQSLCVEDGGTYGTQGYCPPGLERRAERNDRGVAPFSDRHARDMLLLEFLCFDRACDFERSPREWDWRWVERRLHESDYGRRLGRWRIPEILELDEDSRCTSQVLASELGIDVPLVVPNGRSWCIAAAWQSRWRPMVKWAGWATAWLPTSLSSRLPAMAVMLLFAGVVQVACFSVLTAWFVVQLHGDWERGRMSLLRAVGFVLLCCGVFSVGVGMLRRLTADPCRRSLLERLEQFVSSRLFGKSSGERAWTEKGPLQDLWCMILLLLVGNLLLLRITQ